jgi:hypothetical protein
VTQQPYHMASRRAPLVVVGAAALGSLAVAVWALVKLRRVKKDADKLADMRLQERQGRIRAEKVGTKALAPIWWWQRPLGLLLHGPMRPLMGRLLVSQRAREINLRRR